MNGDLLGLWRHDSYGTMAINYKESRSYWGHKINPRIKWGKGGVVLSCVGGRPLHTTGHHTFLLPLELM